MCSLNSFGTSLAVRIWAVVESCSDALGLLEATFDPMFQFPFQPVDAFEASTQIKVDVSNLLVPCHVIRHPIHPAFRVRLQFLLESAQDFQGGLNFPIGHSFRF